MSECICRLCDIKIADADKLSEGSADWLKSCLSRFKLSVSSGCILGERNFPGVGGDMCERIER